MTIRIYYLLLIFILTSCMEEIKNFKHTQTEPEPVVESFFCPDSVFSVRLTLSGNMGADSTRVLPIENANILLSEDGTSLEMLEYNGNARYVSPSGFMPKTNRRYAIEVDVPDHPTIYATDSIPNKPTVESYTVLPESYYEEGIFPRSTVLITITDPSTIDFYEAIAIYNEEGDETPEYKKAYITSHGFLRKQEDYFPYIDAFSNYSGFKGLPFSDVSVNSTTFDLDFLYGNSVWAMGGETVMHQVPHELVLQLNAISYDYYLFRSSLLKQLEKREGDALMGMSEPVPVHSNIQGALGIFAAYNSWSDTTYIETSATRN